MITPTCPNCKLVYTNNHDISSCQGKKNIPKIVVLCGSTRFFKEYDDMSLQFTLSGYIVLSIGSHRASDMRLKITPEQKIMLDELHKRKIDMADFVFIINKNGYIGDSTRDEIEYAITQKKPIQYMELIK